MFLWPTPKPALLAAVQILDDAFGSYAFVSAKLPVNNRPERFVKLTRVGGGLDNITTDSARIVVECFAKDVAQVEAMCNTARAALRNAGGTTVTSGEHRMFIRAWTEEAGPQDYPHPDILDYERWQLTGSLAVKAN
jgi:hypothetical protein